MVKDVGPGDRIIDGHVIRTGVGQVTSFRDVIVPEDTTDYDEWAAAVETETPNRTLGEVEDDKVSKLHLNPWGPGEKPEYWAGGEDAATAWSVGIDVQVGKLYSYDGSKYMCIQAHTTQADWPPNGVGIIAVLFVLVPAAVSTEWAVGVQYVVDQQVTYQGSTYSCIQAHTSIPGWEPPNVPALWGLV